MGSFYSLVGEKTFLGWEPNIPSMGIKKTRIGARPVAPSIEKISFSQKSLHLSTNLSKTV